MSYDADGLRSSKTVAGVKTTYQYVGDKLFYEDRGNGDSFYYFYDSYGKLSAIYHHRNGTKVAYHVVTNSQGDVVALYSWTGTKVAEYSYDAWGNCTIVSDTSSTGIATLNPFRYRGYYYDKDLCLYYLQSRYYDATIGRFINADSQIAGVGGDIQGYNMYSYCMNNPVNMTDGSGNWPKWVSGALNVVSGVSQMVAGATLGALAGWTGLGAVAAGLLIANGAATATQGVGQIINDVTNSNVMREDNIIRTAVAGAGRFVAGDAGAEIATFAYDATVIVANAYASGVINTPSACFIAGTYILSEFGKIAIENIHIGDKVWAENPETGEKELKTVVQTFVNETYELVHVFVNDEEIVTTPNHPFYVPNSGWVKAIELRAGDILVLRNGKYVIIEQIQHEILENPVTVYNFEVEDFHTYYVGESSALVHNDCPRTTNYYTNKAKELGYEKTNYYSHGQRVYYNSKTKTYITPDIDGHNGGTWKMAKSVKDLGSKATRMGTYDENLTLIGD